MAAASSVTSSAVKSETPVVLLRYEPWASFCWLLFWPLMEYIREHLTSCQSRLNPSDTVSYHWSRERRIIHPSAITLCMIWNLSGGLDPGSSSVTGTSQYNQIWISRLPNTRCKMFNYYFHGLWNHSAVSTNFPGGQIFKTASTPSPHPFLNLRSS